MPLVGLTGVLQYIRESAASAHLRAHRKIRGYFAQKRLTLAIEPVTRRTPEMEVEQVAYYVELGVD